ncbi:metal-dependent hydrolase [Bdellovibrionota bacterium FG-2]
MHTHVACLSSQELGRPQEFPGEDCYVSKQMKKSYKFDIYLKALGVTEEELKQKGNFAVIDRLAAKIVTSTRVKRAVILGLDGWVDSATGVLNREKTPTFVPNSFVLASVRRWQKEGLFFYGPSINPNRKDAIEQLEQAKKDGAVLIKWIPSIMNIDPGDLRLKPFYEKMKELGLTLLVHTGKEGTFLDADDKLCDPARLALPLDLGLTLIAAHVATTGSNQGETDFARLGKLFSEVKYRDHLFADISATTQLNHVELFPSFIKYPRFRGRIASPPSPVPPRHTVTFSWDQNHESGVNSAGGGYQVSLTGQPTIKVPYASGSAAPTTTTTSLLSVSYDVTVLAYAALDTMGGNSGSVSAPSQTLSLHVP